MLISSYYFNFRLSLMANYQIMAMGMLFLGNSQRQLSKILILTLSNEPLLQ